MRPATWNDIRVGARVYWTDPDDGLCSRWYRVAIEPDELLGGLQDVDTSISLVSGRAAVDYSECEAFLSELSVEAP